MAIGIVSFPKLSQRLVAEIPEIVKAISDATREMVSALDRYCLNMSSGGTPFAENVSVGLDANDALPILVFTDWCEENDMAVCGAHARKVAAKMTTVLLAEFGQ